MSLTSQARALALLGQMELVFEHSGVPIPPKKRASKRKATPAKAKRARYDQGRFPVGYAAGRFAKLVYSVLVSAGTKVPRWPDSEDTRLSGRVPGEPITLHEMRFAAEHLKDKEPKLAKRIREEAKHWRTQAKAGDALGVIDLVSPPSPTVESPRTEQVREYVGPKLPRWVEDGARVRVKATPWLRKHGLPTSGGENADDRAWPKEVGTIRRRDGDGVWDWVVEFERGRRAVLDEKAAGYLVGVRDEQANSAKPTSPAPEGAALEAAIVADALEVVGAAPHLPRASDVRIYLRPGRKYVRVFWVHRSAAPESLGSVLHFVEKATGAVYAAKSHRSVGRPLGRFISAASTSASEPPPSPAPVTDGATATLKMARAHARAVTQLGELYIDAVKRGAGAPALEAVRKVLGAAVQELEARPVAERRAFVDKVKPAYVAAAELARSVEGEGWRRGGEPLLRRGTQARIFTEDLDRAFAKLGVPRLYVLKTAEATSLPRESELAEVWERDRVVWFRPVAAGEEFRRVELHRGETAWLSLGKRDGERHGAWASINGISRAKRQLKLGSQWVELPLVYSREELAREVTPPGPGEAEPDRDSDFGALLEGLRTRRVRVLRVIDTASSPHTMQVSRVLSFPGSVAVEGKVKRSKAKLTIQTAVDAKGRPFQYARLERGARSHRVDPKRISAAAQSGAAPASVLSERGETAFQRARREKAERNSARLGRRADAQWDDAKAETAGIPMGQPVLVDHPSGRRHRRALDRQQKKARQALETARAAEDAAAAAKRAGSTISSDDPDAIPALEARLAELEASRELNKAINKAFRSGGWSAVEQVPGATIDIIERAKALMKAAHWLKAPTDLKNLGANIRRVRKRIEELKTAAEREASPAIEGAGFSITEHPEDNRIRFTFAARPSKDVVEMMKREGFRWSRRHGAWQRHLNPPGRSAATRVVRALSSIESGPR